MKKLWTGLLAAFLAGAVCLSVAACGKGGGNDPAADAEAFEGKEVTAEQWAAAIALLKKDDTEITLDYVSVQTAEMTMTADDGRVVSGGSSETNTMKYVRKGTMEYLKRTQIAKFTGDYKEILVMSGASPELMDEVVAMFKNPRVGERYRERTEGNNICYYKTPEDGTWKKDDSANDDSALPGSLPTDFLCDIDSGGISGEPREDFSDYVYSAEHKGYIPKDYPESGNALRVIKFDEEGRVVAAVVVGASVFTMFGVQSNTWLFTYKAEDLVLPDVA